MTLCWKVLVTGFVACVGLVAFLFLASIVDSPTDLSDPDTVELDLPESTKRQIPGDVVRAEDRAYRDAEQQYPVRCATGPVSSETAESWAALNSQLSEEYRTEVLEQNGLTDEQWRLISLEGLREDWPLPPPSDPCR